MPAVCLVGLGKLVCFIGMSLWIVSALIIIIETIFAPFLSVHTPHLASNSEIVPHPPGHGNPHSLQEGIKTTLWVTDTGVGMTDEYIHKLLDNKTYTTTLGTNNEKGSGLGLLLAKEFIDRMDGTITVESTIDKGSSFKIVI